MPDQQQQEKQQLQRRQLEELELQLAAELKQRRLLEEQLRKIRAEGEKVHKVSQGEKVHKVSFSGR